MSEPVSSDCDCATGSYGCRYWDQGWLPLAECYTLPLARAVIVALSVPMHVHVHIYSILMTDLSLLSSCHLYTVCAHAMYIQCTMYVDVMLKLMIADSDSLAYCMCTHVYTAHAYMCVNMIM